MKRKNWFKYALLLGTFLYGSVSAHEYMPGMYQWEVKGGTIIITSGLLTNSMALYVHNYNFYFQKEGDKTWYQIPLLDKSKPGNYELNLTSKARDERMVKDARLEIRDKGIYLLRAQSARENDLEDSPITVTKYQFVVTDGEDWPYSFQKISSKTYPVVRNQGMDAVLKEEARQIK